MQTELDDIFHTWNYHRIRKSRTSTHIPVGRPEMLYRFPFLYGGNDHGKNLDIHDVEQFENQCLMKSDPCDPEIFQLCCELVDEYDIPVPDDCHAAIDLYIRLRELIIQAIWKPPVSWKLPVSVELYRHCHDSVYFVNIFVFVCGIVTLGGLQCTPWYVYMGVYHIKRLCYLAIKRIVYSNVSN